MEDIKIKYSCPSVPPEGILIDKIYSIGKNTTGYFLKDNKEIQYLDFEYIKMLFTPVDTTWDKAFESKKK